MYVSCYFLYIMIFGHYLKKSVYLTTKKYVMVLYFTISKVHIFLTMILENECMFKTLKCCKINFLKQWSNETFST